MLIQDILKSARQNTSGRGIFTASRYMTDVASCLTGGACPSQVMSMSSTGEWEKALEAATEKLTATDPEWGFDEKSFATEKGFILVASGVMSTSKMDSDKDILEAKGAEVEAVCPYLWHHMLAQPVGKVLSTSITTIKSGGKDLDAVLFKCGIADVGNGLGRDTALLIELGALRNSHGFEPLEAKPLKNAGWHVTKYRTYEISGVTVPANTDAMFTEFSKEKSRFVSEPVKSWIKGHYDERQKVWSGFNADDLTTAEAVEEAVEHELASEKTACSCQNKSVEETVTPTKLEKVYLPGMPGSWEEIQSKLRSQVREYCKKNLEDCYYAYIEAVFDDYVVLRADDNDYYKVAWSRSEKGPMLTGEPVEIEVVYSVSIEGSPKEDEKAHKPTKKTISNPEITPPVQLRVTDPVLESLGL